MFDAKLISNNNTIISKHIYPKRKNQGDQTQPYIYTYPKPKNNLFWLVCEEEDPYIIEAEDFFLYWKKTKRSRVENHPKLD